MGPRHVLACNTRPRSGRDPVSPARVDLAVLAGPVGTLSQPVPVALVIPVVLAVPVAPVSAASAGLVDLASARLASVAVAVLVLACSVGLRFGHLAPWFDPPRPVAPNQGRPASRGPSLIT
jgi:hypothetical protein